MNTPFPVNEIDPLKRACDLVNKSGMPWHEAERLALSEIGIGDAEINELQGECTTSTVLVDEDLSALIRAVLVHGHRLLQGKGFPANCVACLYRHVDEPVHGGHCKATYDGPDVESACRFYLSGSSSK